MRRPILLKLKSYLGNTSDIQQRWNLSSSPCTWPEISCSRGFIIGINLEYQYLAAIPPIICKLKNLTHLILASTFLSGAFPTVVYNCSKLKVLDISFNKFQGPLPTDIHRMSRLTGLNLRSNFFNGAIPGAVGLLSELKHLHLTGNDFEGSIPREIGNLSNLEILDASSMEKFELATIPNELGNNFEGSIPREIGNLSNLETLDISFMEKFELATIPDELGELKNLRNIRIVNSNLIGNIPEAFSSFFSLVYMDLSRNYLNGSIPDWLFRFENLSDLNLERNQLHGTLPIPIGEAKFSALKLSWNQLSGKIPLEYDKNSNYDFSGNFDLCTCNSSHATKYLPLCTNQKHHKHKAIIIAPVVVGVLVIIVLVCLSCYILKHSKLSLSNCSWKKTREIDEWEFIPFRSTNFTRSEILLNLTEENLIGSGGSGNVYRIGVDENRSHVAVKRICNQRKLDNSLKKQFLAELQTLSGVRHVNIVTLICCISNENSKILVYEYMENQSLDKWLHPKQGRESLVMISPAQNVVLTWDTRLRIAIGAARGLCYMHNHCSPPIIHRDIKSSNILLDNDLNAKVADFGLAKVLAKCGDTETASAVAGTFGYMAPEYAYTAKVSMKSDVYSFGVVLLELVTGREPVHRDEAINLAQRAWKHVEEEELIEDALDEEIKGPANLKAMSEVFKLGLMCTNKVASTRPSMKEVVQVLLLIATNRPS
ncbi:receptor protein kinase CLAVATA1-like isoform X3 [Nicotiana tomentosiformis]|uniref:receptor protein kinase CLAVATA1-like isoform X3 n=1 Tax=Nicotiana tomentosiformis TaxID=4098 RepID=UPI00051ACE02|nr:LRR receptor-like serine/threonine-protein kinase SIK1 isoform X3 [Nicotiana tomentosiformis]